MRRDDVESARRVERNLAKEAYARSASALREANEYANEPPVGSKYWILRAQALEDQVRADQHAYAEHVLNYLLHPPSFPTYKPEEPVVIEGFANPDGSGEGNWSGPPYPGDEGAGSEQGMEVGRG